MSTIRRWTSGFFHRVDTMVSHIENHDGQVAAAIRDAQEARARARVPLARVHRDGERMKRRLAELTEAETRWKERAVSVASSDEARALECVRRRKRAARERNDLHAQLTEHERVEIQLREDMARVEERVARLEHQRNVLRTRESRAGAMAAAHADDAGLLSEIDDIFERWDTKVTAAEYRADCALAGPDDLEARFVASEEAEDLRAELDELVRNEGGDETA